MESKEAHDQRCIKKTNMFSHAIMADVENVNQHLNFSNNLKYSEDLGMRTYSRFLRKCCS